MKIVKEMAFAQSRSYPTICLEGLRTTMVNLSDSSDLAHPV
jgi:hypothetical protein